MLRKLMEMQSKTPLVVLIAKPNQDLIGIPLAESKGKEIGRSSLRDDREVKILREEKEMSPLEPLPGGEKVKGWDFFAELHILGGEEDEGKIEAPYIVQPFLH
ncbi:hypothetical protein MA16_Dca002963 [Dendrobium catenatum]|uniref:Uncharacterized protein n=1 Tax=Dendrobium catenatum TaxID=906689 RepID=A0A2I0X992_9ASPA|nr:hypothetical protein MA16_Dca002963 [Dendrobium catenatum]